MFRQGGQVSIKMGEQTQKCSKAKPSRRESQSASDKELQKWLSFAPLFNSLYTTVILYENYFEHQVYKYAYCIKLYFSTFSMNICLVF